MLLLNMLSLCASLCVYTLVHYSLLRFPVHVHTLVLYSLLRFPVCLHLFITAFCTSLCIYALVHYSLFRFKNKLCAILSILQLII